MDAACPLCNAAYTSLFHRDKGREYIRCQQCALVFVPNRYHLDADAEKEIYDLHNNDIHDPGYRYFLSRLADPLTKRIPPHASGLEFGCGPGPALADILRQRGFSVALYDLFYFPDVSVFTDSYDFITATEVIEHLASPLTELERLVACLKPGGILGLMTKLVSTQEAFAQWHYIRDPTHICFYSRATFEWIAAYFAMRAEFLGKDVILLQRTP